jgi:hypothetical protein
MNFKLWIESQNIELWLDDERDPKDPFIIQNFGSNPNMVWVKNVPEAKTIIQNGSVASISFDNDLGLPEEGYHLAKWIEEQAFNGTLSPMQWRIHSKNSAASKEILMAMQNADRFWLNNKKNKETP